MPRFWPPGSASSEWRWRRAASSTPSPCACPARPKQLLAKAAEAGINLRLVDADWLGIACDQKTNHQTVAALLAVFGQSGADRHRRGRAGQGDAGGPGGRSVPARPLPEPSDLHPLSQRDRDAALFPPAAAQGPGARPLHDPARLLHHEAQRQHRDDPDHLAGILGHPPLRARRPGRKVTRNCSRSWRPGSPRSPASMPSRCSPMPAARANMPGC